MNRSSNIRNRIASFFRCTNGNTMLIFGMSVAALVGAAGGAIDMGRAQMLQAKLSSALDAAGLAAGASASTADIPTEARSYFDANFNASMINATVDSFSAVPNADNTVITLNASASSPTTFMRFFGKTSITVSATSEITRSSKGMELVLVMDTTGSMDDPAGGGVTKIQAARTAATDLINILYGTKTTIDNLWVGLVPFSQGVNIGASRGSWTQSTSFNWGTTSWAGCVDAREASNRDITDDPPSVALFPKYYWPCNTSYNAWYGTNTSRNNCSISGTIRYKSGLGTSLGPNKDCSQQVTPLTATKTTVLNAISTLSANGYTHINLGAVWGWRMLSPRWRDLWGGEMDTEDLPLDYHTDLMEKVVVLMTDGDNTMDNGAHGAYWYLSDNKLGTTSSSTATTILNTRTASVCASMKAQGIIIYTVAFGTSIGTTARNMLQACASKPEYYFYSPTGSDLQTAFRTIGDSLANLRISK